MHRTILTNQRAESHFQVRPDSNIVQDRRPEKMLNYPYSPMQRIFLVEDSPIIRESLVEALSNSTMGRLVVGTAETEDDAFEQIANNSADVAIIDINLREGSGIGLLARLRALDDAPKMRIVYTNHYTRRVHEHCARLGATHVLSKGGNFSELLEVLEHKNG